MTSKQNFIDFMEKEVIPAKNANPKHLRLDGQTEGGNRTVFGYFQHYGRIWKVHNDTRYEPLMLAYKAAINGSDPFVENTTEQRRSSLILQPEIKKHQNTVYKYLYIYEV